MTLRKLALRPIDVDVIYDHHLTPSPFGSPRPSGFLFRQRSVESSSL